MLDGESNSEREQRPKAFSFASHGPPDLIAFGLDTTPRRNRDPATDFFVGSQASPA
jgi:hypothetical protein